MYSQKFQKAIFIDYGFSNILQEEKGYKTLTSFQGTPNYVSKEMLKLLKEGEGKIFIDLYFNDLTGVERTIKYYK